MKQALTITLAILIVPAAVAGTADERCLSALNEATGTLERHGPDALTRSQTEEIRAAEKRAYGICANAAVSAELRNKAIVRWSGSLKPAAAKALLEKALGETEASHGSASAAVLPLLDAIAGLDSNVPERRFQSQQMAERALRTRLQLYGDNSIEVAESLVNMGTFWAMEEMPDRDVRLAEKFFREAILMAEKSDSKSETLKTAAAMLYDLIKRQPGREAEARELQRQLEKLHVDG